jgi:hypothetical protein
MGYDDANSPLFALPQRLIERKERLSHPIIYDDALRKTKFYCLLSRQLRICGYHEFGFRDLACPQAKRLQWQLSALINFLVKYREDVEQLEMQTLKEVSARSRCVPGGGGGGGGFNCSTRQFATKGLF